MELILWSETPQVKNAMNVHGNVFPEYYLVFQHEWAQKEVPK
jgi:hypothetical protein